MDVKTTLLPGVNGTKALLRELIKHNGGYWNPDKKAWHLSYRKVVELSLEKRNLDHELAF